MTLLKDFEDYIEKIPESGCWIWMAGTRAGYGIYKQVYAHRYSYEKYKGSISDGLHVLHRCDIRTCVNPEHLFLGTNDDNIADMVSKGRHSNGNKNKTHCKRGHELTPENVYIKKHGGRECKTCAMEQQYIRRHTHG